MNSGAHGRSPVFAKPWLRPTVAALLALTDDVPNRDAILADPGLVLHILRFSRPTPLPNSFSFDNRTLTQPGLCQTAATLWERDHAEHPVQPSALKLGLAAAQIAAEIAKQSELCSPDAAYAAALLSPLAFYMGNDSPTRARRILSRWQMPEWLTATLGYPELCTDDAVKLGSPHGLLRVVRTAIRIAESRHESLGLLLANEPIDAELEEFAPETTPVSLPQKSDHDGSLIPRLLRLAATARSRNGAALLAAAEDRIDELVQSLANANTDFDHALRDAKLASLAEFAAGASHEINNPLAVIAGNVQLLKNLDPDPEYQAQLATILRQTKRIHDILVGTRQFARPTTPQCVRMRVETLLEGVRKDLEPEAESRQVRLDFAATSESVYGDTTQLRTALSHLVRNALEAAGPGGSVAVSTETDGGKILFAIEDSGTGPGREALPHLFDPFFSGREAGRGRGLGLPIAWRLLRANEGDVRFAPTAERPSRFLVSLPAAPVELKYHPAERKSA